MSNVWYASSDAQRLLTSAGLNSIDDAFRIGQPLEGMRRLKGSRHEYKEVVIANLARDNLSSQIYIKRQWRRERLLPRWTDVRRKRFTFGCPVAEWQGLMRLRSVGISAAEPLALFRQSWCSARSAILTRAVPAAHSLNELLDLGIVQTLHTDQAISLAGAVLHTIEQIQAAGLGWRSMKAKHFYPELLDTGEWRVWLIDCEGVYARASRRDRSKDRRRFLESLHRVPDDHGVHSYLAHRLSNASPETGTIAARRSAPLHSPTRLTAPH